MTQPDFGGEEDQDWQPGILPQDREDSPEREIGERAREERDLEQEYLDKDNEAHAAGQVCLGAERSSPRARTRGDDQTAAGYTRSARWIWASRRERVRGRQPTTDPASGAKARAEPPARAR